MTDITNSGASIALPLPMPAPMPKEQQEDDRVQEADFTKGIPELIDNQTREKFYKDKNRRFSRWEDPAERA